MSTFDLEKYSCKAIDGGFEGQEPPSPTPLKQPEMRDLFEPIPVPLPVPTFKRTKREGYSDVLELTRRSKLDEVSTYPLPVKDPAEQYAHAFGPEPAYYPRKWNNAPFRARHYVETLGFYCIPFIVTAVITTRTGTAKQVKKTWEQTTDLEGLLGRFGKDMHELEHLSSKTFYDLTIRCPPDTVKDFHGVVAWYLQDKYEDCAITNLYLEFKMPDVTVEVHTIADYDYPPVFFSRTKLEFN